MDRDEVKEKVKEFVKERLEGKDSAHDWWHVHRAWKNAVRIGKEEGGDLFVIELAALLHDVEDWKFSDSRDSGKNLAREWLEEMGVSDDIVSRVTDIVENVSFKGAGVDSEMESLEGKIVQDADRLDAIGAIGIARCFAYGGSEGKPIHEPGEEPEDHETFEEYRKSDSSSINHFHEKLLLLKDRMNTETAEEIAEGRHEFMEEFLERFHEEWEGEE